jgi:hypothetical protein
LLWAGALLCLALLLAAISVLRAGLWVRDEAARAVSIGRRRREVFPS